MAERVIVFDIWGQFAHFKKIYVTTSALSYAVPFKTSIYGMVGAILGMENSENQYLTSFKEGKCQIGIQLINPVQFQRININLSPTPGPIKDNRKPTLMEFVVRPHYRIYFSHTDKKLVDELKDSLKRKASVFTPVLGLAFCLANFRYIGEGSVEKKEGISLIQTAILKSNLKSFDQDYWIENNIHIQEQDMYPLEMNPSREVTKRDSLIYDLNGKAIKVNSKGHYELKLNGNVSDVMMM
ncbi:CRISPR-associated protein Cas5 [Nitritalea halalkaliphila LW7]|uniref:CRISPR-associated protein Cas5 n=1 Tax=Nitritalea halalkaliphila LW7 TaxID=1189621 RepID=I5BY70_9BACT|nr:type I-B CRISPR-associated protein Cas5b [Nitritalea halalkaliphila]EIM74522.1 CRISPR-associated protein Cas5 [Nitritalea halalkaliphila LW7]